MNSLQIEQILSKNRVSGKYFKGVFSSNNLEVFTTYPHCFVANTDKVHSPGTHWVAFYVPNVDSIEIFDSFGNSPNNDFKKYLKQFKNVQLNSIVIQAPFSNACGQYCIFFVIWRSAGLPFEKIVKILSHKNDRYVKYFVVKFLLSST